MHVDDEIHISTPVVPGTWARIERIERHLAGMDLGAFLNDEKTIDAVVRSLQVIGEAKS